MVQNMRAYFILYVITIKCINCMQEKTDFSCTKTKVDLNQNFRRTLLGYKDKATRNNNKKLQENPPGWQKDGILLPRGGICHPIATRLQSKSEVNEQDGMLWLTYLCCLVASSKIQFN